MNRRDALKSVMVGGLVAQSVAAGEEPSAANQRRAVRFAHFTDTHVYDRRRAPEGLATAIRHVNALDDPPEFVLNGGDAVYDALEEPRDAVLAQWGIWKAAWQNNGSLPMRHCLGNHDVWGWNKKNSQTSGNEAGWGKQLALDQLELPSAHYTFEAGGWRFLVLDSMTFDDETIYRAEIDEAQRAWLADQLKATPPQTHVAIVSHIPILTVGTVGFTPELRKMPHLSRVLSHQDAYELLEILDGYPNIRLCLSGHTHQTERVTFGPLQFVNSGAVSGLWWKGKFRHTLEGYNVIDLFDDGSFATTYTPYGWNAAT